MDIRETTGFEERKSPAALGATGVKDSTFSVVGIYLLAA
jgi:hypothetical protein